MKPGGGSIRLGDVPQGQDRSRDERRDIPDLDGSLLQSAPDLRLRPREDAEAPCQNPDWDLIGRLWNWLCTDTPIQPDGAAEVLLRGTGQVNQAEDHWWTWDFCFSGLVQLKK